MSLVFFMRYSVREWNSESVTLSTWLAMVLEVA